MPYEYSGIHPPRYETAQAHSPFIPPVTEEELFSATTLPETASLPAKKTIGAPELIPVQKKYNDPRQINLHLDLRSGILKITIE